jgi:glyceraldehyde 3-phosphate dehydrogenase
VPIPTGSATDLHRELSRETRSTRSTRPCKAAADGPDEGLPALQHRPIVSSDIVTDPASCIFDAAADAR